MNYEKQHTKNINRYKKQVAELFASAATDAANLKKLIGDIGDRPFVWKDYPLAAAKMKALLKRLQGDLQTVVLNGITAEWELSNGKNDTLCKSIFGNDEENLSPKQRAQYFNTHAAALTAFTKRKEGGLGLSARVWNACEQLQEELELGLSIGIAEGKSAAQISRDIRQCLKNPNMLFRRVRNKYGKLELSKRAKAYHPGRGVYRSSYKNALRLTSTETNIAYRTADYLRYQDLTFIVGVRVVLSNNHPVSDICNELSAPCGSTANKGRGCYPKDFKFVGWHPHCRCHIETILKTREELKKDNARLMKGKTANTPSINEVKELPREFSQWLNDNRKRIEGAKSLPYFLQDNKKFVPNI